MTKPKPSDAKVASLRQRGTLNPRPGSVKDPLFTSGGFFDPRDLVQVKYEMVRRVQVDGQSVSEAALAFGFSRPSFYQAQSVLAQGGLAALIPQKPGPRRSHKLSPDVLDFLLQERSLDGSVDSRELAQRVLSHFSLKIHPRSIEKAMARLEKKHQ